MASATRSLGSWVMAEIKEKLGFETVLADRAPGASYDVDLPLTLLRVTMPVYVSSFAQPALRLWCDHPTCNALMWFDPIADDGERPTVLAKAEALNEQLLVYLCRHCRERLKYISVLIHRRDTASKVATVTKFGEFPPFGPPLPTRLVTMAGRRQEFLYKGRRCENQGLGVAAFAYYRRIVEELKNDILEELIKAAQVLRADAAVVASLEKAKHETQFVRAIETIKPGVPESLLIHGQNPLLLLHGALSEGLHSLSDERCLELATAVRTVLTEMTERLATVMKQDSELSKAVHVLAQKKSKQ